MTSEEKAYCFRLATRCQIRSPRSDSDFMKLVDEGFSLGLSIDEAEAKWKLIVERRKNRVSELHPANVIERLANDWSSCDRCSLHKGRKNLVMGRGSIPCDILIIGEAPGEQEDIQGLPFVGPSGHILNRVLKGVEQAGLTYYITNLVACRPPGNTTPTGAQVERCSPRLARIVSNVRPYLAVLLGAQALRRTVDLHSIAEHRGTFHFWEEFTLPVIATWHPSAIMRSEDPERMREFRRDFEKAIERARDMSVVPF